MCAAETRKRWNGVLKSTLSPRAQHTGRRTTGIFCGIEMVELRPTSPPKPQHHNNGAQQRALLLTRAASEDRPERNILENYKTSYRIATSGWKGCFRSFSTTSAARAFWPKTSLDWVLGVGWCHWQKYEFSRWVNRLERTMFTHSIELQYNLQEKNWFWNIS